MASTITDRLQGISTSVAVKAPCRVATIANITLSGLQTIDTVLLVDNDRVLVKNQTSNIQNGIYYAHSTSWERTEDLDSGDDVVDGTTVFINEGSVNVHNWFVADTSAAFPIVIGTDHITWSQTYVSLTAVSQATESIAGVAELATQAETNTGTDDLRIVTPKKLHDGVYNPNGKHVVWVPAAGMQSATTNGAAAGTVETTTNKVLYRTLDFDTTTQEFSGFALAMPKSWNESTVTFIALWTAASGSGGVAWALQGLACSDGDSIDAAYGTEQVVTDTLIAAGDVHRTAESSAITIAGTPTTSDTVFFRVKRVPANVSDTLAVDARLIGVELYITTDSGTDA